MPKKTESFESSIDRLDEIVRTLEHGDAPLSELLKLFSEGAVLVKKCTKFLDSAEQKVTKLAVSDEGELTESEFTAGEE